MFISLKPYYFVGLLVTSALTACNSSNDNSDSFSRIGMILVNDSTFDNSVDLEVTFFAVDPSVTIEQITSIDEVISDTCEVDTELAESDENTSSELLDAGEKITFTGPDGVYAEFVRSDSLNFSLYSAPQNVSSPAPAELTVDIPGDQFPSFTNVAVPYVEPFLLTSHSSGQSISVSSEVTWQASENTVIPIRLYTVTTLADGKRITVDCLLLDDGSFSFTAAEQAQLSGAGLETLTLNIGREVRVVRQTGDAALIVTRRSGDL